MRKLVKVEGSKSLVRDMNSKAIINTDKKELEHSIAARKRKKQQHQDIENLKTDVADIKNMLEQILEKIK